MDEESALNPRQIFYIKYEKEEEKNRVVTEIKKYNRIAEVTKIQERKVEMTGAVDADYISKAPTTTQRSQTKKPTRWILLWYREGNRNYMKAKGYLRAQLNKNEKYKCKRYRKGIMVESKNDMISRTLLSEGLTKIETSPFKRIEPHKKINEYWWMVMSRDLAEYTNEEVEAMCPEWVIQAIMARKDKKGKSLGKPIIKLPTEREVEDTHIAIGGERFEIRRKTSDMQKMYEIQTPKKILHQ